MDNLNIAITLVQDLLIKTKKNSLFTEEILKLIKQVNYDRLTLLKNAETVRKFAKEIKIRTGKDTSSQTYWENQSRFYLMEALEALINLKLGDQSYFVKILSHCVKCLANHKTYELAKKDRNCKNKEELRGKLVGTFGSGGYPNFVRFAKYEQDRFLKRMRKGE